VIALARRGKKWIKGAIKRPGALRKKMGVAKGKKIPASKLAARKKVLQKKGEGEKKLTTTERRELRQITLAQTLRKLPRRRRRR